VLAHGSGSGPLAGTTLAVKDVFDVAGTITGAGNPDFATGRPTAENHARAVELLVAAGATVVGKTITDELAYSLSGTNVHFGTPTNSAAPGHVPGGSSAGSAAAVAAGLCDLALGTDTGGSIRVPASYCGIVGWRPTHGAVSPEGIIHLARSFDTVGLLARSSTLLATAADVLLGEPPAPSDPIGGAVGVIELFDAVEADVASALERAIDPWCHAGAIEVGVDLQSAVETFRVIQGGEAWAEHGAWITQARPRMGPGIAERFAVASQVTPPQIEAAGEVRRAVRRLVIDATQGGRRVLLGPAAASAAPRGDESPERAASIRSRTLRLTCLAGLAGAPVVVLPVARDQGLPLGVAGLGAPGTDRALLDWAATSFPDQRR
jgi:amidase